MPFIPAVNTAQVTIRQRLHGQVITNRVFFQREAGWGPADLTALANMTIGWWNDELAPMLSQNITLEWVNARDLEVEEGAGVEIQAPAGSGGDVPSPSVPGNVALVAKLITGLTGRNRRGRMFLTGFPNIPTVILGNQIAATTRDAVVAALGELRNLGLAAGYIWVVASFYNGMVNEPGPNGTIRRVPEPRPTGLLTPVETITADVDLDSQRRRLTGRGV